MKVQDVMTTEVHSLRFDKKMVIAEEIMNWARVRHVPIVDGGNRVVGMITHRDLLRASISRFSTEVASAEKHQHLAEIPITTLMQPEVQTIHPNATIQEAARKLRKNKIGCLPVVDGSDKLIGILSEYDLLGVIEKMPESVL